MNNGEQKGGGEKMQEPKKRLVHYRELVMCKLGSSAMVLPVDHPSDLVSNEKLIVTSQVVNGPDEAGCFETLNTRYEPLPKIKPKRA